MEKWNNLEEYDIDEPLWKAALDFVKDHPAREEHSQAETQQSLLHIYAVMDILREEANLYSDSLLATAILMIAARDTGCNMTDIKDRFKDKIAGAVDLLVRKDNQSFEEYTRTVFTNSDYQWTGHIFLADWLYHLRQLPSSRKQEDIEAAIKLTEKVILPYEYCSLPILIHKIKEKISDQQGKTENRQV